MKSTSHFYEDISQILLEARQKAYTSINSEMVMAYWRIGKRIVEEEQLGEKRAEYGSFLIKQLSERLTKEFGKGFSAVNIKNFRQFYLTFPDDQKSYALRSQLTWTHYRCIMRVENAEQETTTSQKPPIRTGEPRVLQLRPLMIPIPLLKLLQLPLIQQLKHIGPPRPVPLNKRHMPAIKPIKHDP
jgi:hypothetical protein